MTFCDVDSVTFRISLIILFLRIKLNFVTITNSRAFSIAFLLLVPCNMFISSG